MPLEAAVLAILQSVVGSLIAKAPPAVQHKLASKRSLQKELKSAWDQARKAVLGAKLPFDAYIDEKVLAKIVFRHVLDPYWLMRPEERQLALAVRTAWLGEDKAEEAVKTFVSEFVESWKHTESFAALGQWFEEIEANKVLSEIRDAIVAAAEKDVRVRAASISAPPAALLIKYCDGLSAGAITARFLARSAKERSSSKGAPAEPSPLDQVFAGHDRVILVGEGGMGKTMALRHREQMLAGNYAGGEGSPVPVYLKLSDYRGEELESAVAERVNRVLTGSDQLLAETAEESARAVRSWLSKEPGTVEILLDGLNEVPEDHTEKFHSHLNAFLCYKQRFVFSSRDYDADPLPGRSVPVFSLARLKPDEIRDLLIQELGLSGEQAAVTFGSDDKLAALVSNPFYLDLMAKLWNSPGSLPENRALLFRESVIEARKSLLQEEGTLVGAAAKSGVVEAFLKSLGWKMLREGVVTSFYNTVYEWNLPLSGHRLDELLIGASRLRLLASAGEQSTPIEFRHPIFRDYFAAERVAELLLRGSDLETATEKEYAVPAWSDVVQMAAGLLGTKASSLVGWLIAKDQLDLAFDCWAESPARNDRGVAAQLAATLRAWVSSSDHLQFADSVITQLGELQDPNAVPLITQFLAQGPSWAHWEAIPALEKIRSGDAMAALAAAIKSSDEDTSRDAKAALRRIGADAVPELLREGSAGADQILYEVAPKALDALTAASKDCEKSVRASAVLALGYTGRSEAVDLLSKCLLQDEEPRVRTNAAIALSKLGDPAAIPALRKALTYRTAGGDADSSAAPGPQKGESATVRLEAASALWENGWAAREAKAVFFELYQSMGTHASWRAMILKRLVDRVDQGPDQDTLALLVKMCRDENEEVRNSAFALLHRVPEKVNVDDVLALGLRDSSGNVRAYALANLWERYGERTLSWLLKAFEENPSRNYGVVELVDWRFGEAGREFLIRIIESGADEAVRAKAVTAVSRFKRPDDTALEIALQKADATAEPYLVEKLILAMRDSRNPAVMARIRSFAEDPTVTEKLREVAQYILRRLTARRAL